MTTLYPTDGTTSPVLAELGLLYGHMVEEIRASRNKEKNELQRFGLLLEIAQSHKERLMQKMDGYRFGDVAEQILYYRHIKPLFLSETLYHSYRYDAELFLKDFTDRAERISYLREQLQRLDEFATQHPCFSSFIENGNAAMEADWFTSFDDVEHSDEEASCKGEELMGTWMALQRFNTYINRQLIREKHAGSDLM